MEERRRAGYEEKGRVTRVEVIEGGREESITVALSRCAENAARRR